MKTELLRIPTDFDQKQCYVHARGAILPNGFGILTTQKLELRGEDDFYGIEIMTTQDGGKTFSAPKPCEELRRQYYEDKSSSVMCDATPFYHQATKKFLLVGQLAYYHEPSPVARSTAYAVYDEKSATFLPYRMIAMPQGEEDTYFISSAGCSQIHEEANGDLLIPICYQTRTIAATRKMYTLVAVMRCSFDGETILCKEIGNSIAVECARGLCEPSIVAFGGAYYLALRNDESGYVCKSEDGVHLQEPLPLCFENNENAGNYNTQQHWLCGGGRLYMVYTRRAENNSHVFRHRAPLFMAEFDPQAMCLLKGTEAIVVPERGARLGNFGCQSFSREIGYVFAAEWMQGNHGLEGCQKYGSDNSIFVSKILFEEEKA